MTMDPVIVQQKSATSTTAQLSVTVTLDSTPVAGNLLVAVCKDNTASATDTDLPTGFTWVTDSPYTAGTARSLGIAVKRAGISEPTAKTFTSDVSAVKMMCIYELEDTEDFYTAVLTDGTGGSVTSRQLTTTGILPKAKCFVVAVSEQGSNNGGTESVNSSFTLRDAGTHNAFLVADKITNATTALAPTFSWATARVNFGMQAIFPGAEEPVPEEMDVQMYDGADWIDHYTTVIV